MGLVIAQDLLRQYNKNNPYTRTTDIDSQADQSTKKFGTWSYANMYDALYDKYSQDRNFNINMWRQAVKLGEQDQYLAFLEQNKGTTLSDKFYDPQYYDYESMMLELYLPFADATALVDEDGKPKDRTRDVYDAVTGQWVTENLGPMTDRQYIQYQLDLARETRAAEITRTLEQERKDQLGWWGQFGNDVAATLAELGEGVLSGLTGILDFVGGLGYASYQGIVEGENWADAFVNYFGEVGLTALEKRTVRAALDEYERTHTHFRDIDGNITGVGTYVAGIANSIGMMAPAIVTAYFTGGTSLAFLGPTSFYMSIFSHNMYENATNPYRIDSPSGLKIANAAVKTGIEAVIEYALGKLLGGTIQNNLIGLGGGAMGKNLSALTAKGLTKGGWKYLLKSAGQEGLEEFLQDFSTDCVDQFTAMIEEGKYAGYGKTGVTMQTLIDSFFAGAISSLFMSGGQIGLSAVRSGISNKVKPGSGDLLIETEAGPQKVRGVGKLYYSSILSEFQQAVNELKKGKMSADKNIELAQEVYSTLTVLSQFYSTFDMDRLKNCEMLLDRVVKAEEFKSNNERAASILSPETISQIEAHDKTVKAQVKNLTKSRAQMLGLEIDRTFKSMVGEVAVRYEKQVHEASDELKDKLDAGGVTTTTGAVDGDGVRYKRDPAMEELEAKLGKVASDRLEELRKDYDWVFTTDGHIALESKGILFVSEAWLQNYETSDIYKFLVQTKILETIATDETLKPMIEKLIRFDKRFTKQTDVDAERAIMDLLFNKSVYQAFLLTNNGKNAHEFKDFIFRLHDLVKALGEESGYYKQQFKGKQSQKRINMLNEIYEQIKTTMREPTIKAILGWKFDPQQIGADSVLTDRDRQFINAYQTRRNVAKSANKVGAIPSAYANLAKDIIAKSNFSRKTAKIVKNGLRDNATLSERLQATAILDEADRRLAVYDFNLSAEYSIVQSKYSEISAQYKTLAEEALRNAIYGERTDFKPLCEQALQVIDEVSKYTTDTKLVEYGEALHERGMALIQNENAGVQDYRQIVDLSMKYMDKLLIDLYPVSKKPSKFGIFTLPAQVMNLSKTDIAQAQFVADKLNEFYDIYGVSARQMFMNDLTGMSLEQRSQLTQDMQILSIDDVTQFIITKLEGMLGNDYIVTRVDNNGIIDFTVAVKVPAERFLPKAILDVPLEQRNEFFLGVFNYDKKHHAFYDPKLKKFVERPGWDGKAHTLDPETFDWVDDIDVAYFNGLKAKPLSEFINFKKLPQQMRDMLKNVTVYFEDAGRNVAGYATGNIIAIDPNKSSDYFDTLIHEVNHIIQEKSHLPGGFSTDMAYDMPDFLAYVMNEYTDYIAYVFEEEGYELPKRLTAGEVTEDDIDGLLISYRDIIAHCAYMLVQGEVWARAYAHNGKPVHGFTTDGIYLVSPDGKTRFRVTQTTSENHFASQSVTPEVASSALDAAVKRVFAAKAAIERRGYMRSGVTRNTYHSSLTRTSNMAVMQKVLNPALGIVQRISATVDKVIKDPATYLSNELLQSLNGDYSEGNTFYRLKEYIEANFKGVSLDRTYETNEYVLVDDNAFDDLLLPTMLGKIDSEEHILYNKFKGRERIALSEFYSEKQLAYLGINPTTYIVMKPGIKTETAIDQEHRSGALFIGADEKTTDRQIIDKVNHEFRHLLQYYNGFERGFTPDFKVSKEMIADVKAHVPGLFKDSSIRKWADQNAVITGDTSDAEIVKHFVYFLVGGELNAYSIRASELSIKPIYVKDDGGTPTIFMPWYNAKTGEGRYQTEFMAMRADDKSIVLPQVNKPKKYKAAIVEDIEKPKDITYVYTQRRDYTWKKAKGTNLEIFARRQKAAGERLQMDPDLQEFVIATTGHESELPGPIVNAIKKGILTKQALFKWFRNVKTENVNEFTFDLLNKYIFKNNHITSMQELDTLLDADPSFYWAAAIVLRREGLSLESLILENDVAKFKDFINSVEGSTWKAKIDEMQTEFNIVWIGDGKGHGKYEHIAYDDRVQDYMRVLTMQWFDGTLAGAFYVARAFQKTIRVYEEEQRDVISIDASHSNAKGDKATTLADKLSTSAGLKGNDASVANDIIAIYEKQIDKSSEEMIQELSFAYYQKLARDAGLNPDRMSQENKLKLAQQSLVYMRKLRKMSYDEIANRYAEIANAEMTDTETETEVFDTGVKHYKTDRVNIVARIKRTSTALLKLIREGKIAFTDLPKEIQDMFEVVSATTETGKKTEVYQLKSSVYEVGRGRKVLPGATDTTGRFNYQAKHNITEGNEAFRHDTTRILANDEALRNILKAARAEVASRKSGIKKTAKVVSDLQKRLDAAMRAQQAPKAEGNVRTTEIKTSKKKKRTSDTPNYFTIVSAIDMPPVLNKILDVSFEELANTEVQFASRDENGNLLDRSVFKKGEFESRVKHEVNNWDAFYEATRTNLLALSRNDVLDIVEFFQRGMSTLDGPANKLAAFEIFVLGYIVDGARRNHNNWNFSDQEIEMIEQVYESKASFHGSGLNAVQQMLKVVDPMKKVRQRMLDDYNIDEAELQPLFNAVDKLQKAPDLATRNAEVKNVAAELERIEALMVQNDMTERGWGKRWYQKMKSYRYTAMLSSPMTWIRNIVSNVAMLGLNKSADTLGSMIFVKKGYRKDQWNLNGVKVSEDVRQFIEDNIKDNPIFDALYDTTSKYDDRRKGTQDQSALFVSMIVSALEQKYAAQHRFDNKTANAISMFVTKMISDKPFIKFVTGRYLGKILTIEVKKGNIDLSQGLTNDVLNLFAEAVILGNTEYMHRRSFLADMTDSLRESHPVAYEVLTLWQPFLNSSFNWFQETLKYTPIGLANAIVRMCKLEQQITKIDAKRAKGELIPDSRVAEFLVRRDIGKGTIGLILTGLGIMMGLTGMLKLEDDDDKFYIIVGDVKVDISDVFGTSSLLVGASIAQIWVESDGEKAGFDEVMRLVAAQMFEGFVLNDILSRHKWDEGFWDGMLTESESVLRSFVPQFVQLIIRATNNEQIKYSPGMAGMWERWLNSFVPTQPFGDRKVNPYTGQVETKYALPFFGEFLKSGIFGAKIYWSEVSEVERMCRELGVNKNMLTGELTVDGEKYALDVMALNEKYGELNAESLAKIKSQKHTVEMPDGTFKTLSWDKMSDKQRANVLNRTMVQNAEIAKIYIWTQQMGKKFYASNSLWQTLRKLGITRNVYKGDKGFVE